ncbi:glycosyl transferase [Haloferax sp. Atlit-47N]|uniref:Glycosyltransferase n=1 Tax=Haloferax sp. Atlit-48N TaxID=2077198 RepID=A0ACD5I006_9EURY|nr:MULTISPECIES: glycosyltransferase [unclassified Haloferax]RDZ32373.1 glycosyl transferase [Haloferax sp. Atlit-48N]RDZ40559.1 glycosyl transferase [Haloferax sp. Atlit-47N]
MTSALPFVSVIIPVYNEAENIQKCLNAVTSQTYPKSKYEVLVVDNGSQDGTKEIARQFSTAYDNLEILIEDEQQGSYAARNTGIEQSSGAILAFLDGDCSPHQQWLERGVSTISGTGVDLVGGNVEFTYPNGGTAAERYDSFTNMQMKESISKRNVAKTVNLFVRQDVVEDVGPFPNHLISGGDVHWTKRATDAGYSLTFAHDAIGCHPARPFGELLKKQFRVGKGQIQVWMLDRISLRRVFALALWILVGFLPKPPHYLSQDLRRTGQTVTKAMFVRILVVAWCCRLAENAGRLSYILRSEEQ